MCIFVSSICFASKKDVSTITCPSAFACGGDVCATYDNPGGIWPYRWENTEHLAGLYNFSNADYMVYNNTIDCYYYNPYMSPYAYPIHATGSGYMPYLPNSRWIGNPAQAYYCDNANPGPHNINDCPLWVN